MQFFVQPSHLTTDPALSQVLLTFKIRLSHEHAAPFNEALRRPELVIGSVLDLTVPEGQANVVTYRDGKSTAKLGPEQPSRSTAKLGPAQPSSTRHFLSGAFDWPPEQAPSRSLQPLTPYRVNLALSDNDQRLKTFLAHRVVQSGFASVFQFPATTDRARLSLEFM
jgi:hypothetical protein